MWKKCTSNEAAKTTGSSRIWETIYESCSYFIYLFIYLLYLTLVYKIVKNNSTNKY